MFGNLPGIWEILIIAVVLVLLFGRGKISDLMGDVAKGIKSFKKGLADDETTGGASASLEAQAPPPESPSSQGDKSDAG